MKTSLIVFGVIFLVLGGLLYFVPLQQFKADTTTVGAGGSDTRTSSASLTIPIGWAYASAIIGFVLLVFGLAIPGSKRFIPGPRGPRGRSAARRRLAPRRKSRRAVLPRGTSVTTTTRIKR